MRTAFALFALIPAAAGAVDYHVSPSGSDQHCGKMPSRPWKSLEKVNSLDLGPGDRVLLEGGKTFNGTLSFDRDDGGSADGPAILSSYGEGRATIDGGNGTAIRIENLEHFVVRDVNVVGSGRKDGNTASGVHVSDSKHVTVEDVDASGFQKAGVYFWATDHARIVRVYAHDNGGAGILAMSMSWPDRYAKDLYIGHCRADNNPGDPTVLDNHSGNGILFGGINGALVEYCSATGNGWDMPRGGNGPVGIWCWQTDSAVIQYCIAHHNKTSEKGYDGGGFDFDGGVRNSIYQYCLSYENQGPGYLMYQYWGAGDWENNTVRYCVSINDGWHNTTGALLYGGESDRGHIKDLKAYNNFFYNDRKAVLELHIDPPSYFANNVLIGTKGFAAGKTSHARFEANVIWNPDDPDAATRKGGEQLRSVGKFADPRIALPKDWSDLPTDPEKLKDLAIFRLLDGSPCAGAGVRIEDAGGRDFFGNPLPEGKDPSIGIHEPGGR